MNDEIEKYRNLNIKQKLTESDNNNIDNKSQFESQIRILETKDPGWIFDKNDSLRRTFYKFDKLNGPS